MNPGEDIPIDTGLPSCQALDDLSLITKSFFYGHFEITSPATKAVYFFAIGSQHG
jgi:hypothetical protein